MRFRVSSSGAFRSSALGCLPFGGLFRLFFNDYRVTGPEFPYCRFIHSAPLKVEKIPAYTVGNFLEVG